MITVNVKKGWRFKIAGMPTDRLEGRPAGSRLAMVCEQLPFIKPRLLVSEGDRVRIGTALFEDKKQPELKFLSPGGGRIERITYGPRRVIREIIIRINGPEEYESFGTYTESKLKQLDRSHLTALLMDGGMWPLLRQLPFRRIADPNSQPSAIWVSLGSADPFQPNAEVYLKEQLTDFEFGLKALQRLADAVNVCAVEKSLVVSNPMRSLVTHQVTDRFPASDPGVVLYHTKKSSAQNNDWYIDGQGVILVGQFLSTGIYPVNRVVAFSAKSDSTNCHLKTRTGICLQDLSSKTIDPDCSQFVIGGILSGYTAEASGFLGFYDTSLMLVDKRQASEFFGFLRPGRKKLSHSKTVLSALFPSPLPIDSDMHGEKRPCINCGYCASVCPVDIMPQYAYKCLYADEIEEALAHGLLDCVECGLCSFVCPSKIELSGTLIQARHQYHKELSQVNEVD